MLGALEANLVGSVVVALETEARWAVLFAVEGLHAVQRRLVCLLHPLRNLTRQRRVVAVRSPSLIYRSPSTH